MGNLIGQSLGQYELTALLGEGGMAAVYRAQASNLKRDVAVKVIKTGLVNPEKMDEFVRRFRFEAETIASLSHPHILKLFDYGQHEDVVYLVVELLTGGNLAQLISRGPLRVDSVLRFLDQVGSALDYAHEHAVIHRDVKPQNILLDERGNAILTDFGIAKILDETTEFTKSGMLVGTPAYMAPEQWRGEAPTVRVDIYALGAVLFEMLVGRLPFTADTPHSLMHMHIYERPPLLRSLNPAIPDSVEYVVDKALAKDPDQRFQSITDLMDAFRKGVQPLTTGDTFGGAAAGNASSSAASEPGKLPMPSAQVSAKDVPGTKRIFISYTRADQNFADQLHEQLQVWHYETWIDIHDIPKGAYWPNAIDDALQSCDVVIGLLSPEALESRNVRNEWDWACANDKPLLLLLLRECPNIPHQYISINYIEFTHHKPQGFAQLKAALEQTTSPYQESRPSLAVKTSPSRPELTNRGKMLKKVHDFWIVGVLDNAVHERKVFDLNLEFAAPGAVLKSVDHSDYRLPTTASIFDVFQDMNRELLILGQPGAGKTILLLQLTRELIVQAQADPAQPIPVVFNLSSWAVDRGPLETWLITELRTKYQIPVKVATTWVNNGEILPLLDGLDEVLAEYRDACIEAINRFRQEYQFVDMVVCSRIEDYEKLTHRLNLQSSVILQPLTKAQIDNHIKAPDLTGLQTVMKADLVLQQIAQSPFLLNTMAFAYRGMSAAALSGFTSEEDRRNHLFTNYVERKFQLQESDKTFTLKQMFNWLPALADQMVKHGQTLFFIERMQPTWLSLPGQRRLYVGAVGLAGGLIAGLGAALIITVISAILATLAEGLIAGLIAGVVFGTAVGAFFAFSARTQDIEVTETLTWSWAKGRVGLAIGLVGALGGSLVYGLARNTLIGIPFGLMLGLAIGLAFGLTGGLTGNEVQMRTAPNQGIRRSAQNAISIGLVFGIVIALVVGLIFGVGLALVVGPRINLVVKLGFGITLGLSLGLTSGLCFGLAVALIRGGKTVIEHVILRIILYRNGSIPWNYSRFLDYAAKLNVLRRVGGGYIFMHRYLLEYFASLAKP